MHTHTSLNKHIHGVQIIDLQKDINNHNLINISLVSNPSHGLLPINYNH